MGRESAAGNLAATPVENGGEGEAHSLLREVSERESRRPDKIHS
jgi:hypothetical protein